MANLAQIEKFLKQKKLPYKVVDLGVEVFTVEGVKKAGVSEDDIVKTLIVRGNDQFIALAVRGKDRVDFKKVRKLLGSKSELASAQEVEKVVRVPIGAVCPILLDIPLTFDEKVSGISSNIGQTAPMGTLTTFSTSCALASSLLLPRSFLTFLKSTLSFPLTASAIN